MVVRENLEAIEYRVFVCIKWKAKIPHRENCSITQSEKVTKRQQRQKSIHPIDIYMNTHSPDLVELLSKVAG